MSAPTVDELRQAWHDAEGEIEPRPYWSETLRRFAANRAGMVSAIVLALIILAAVCAPLLTSSDPNVGIAQDRLMGVFSRGHLLGTDEQGRDLLARILYGGRLSLLAGLGPTVAATVIGTLLGAWAGLTGGVVGTAIMRVLDMLYAFPAILLAIAIGASLGPGLLNAMIAVTIVFVPPVARVAEGATRRVAVQEYMEAARLTGASRLRVLRTQLLPNVTNSIVVYASGLVGVAMIIAASLSFLGLGAKPPTAEWGYMLNSLRGAIYVSPFLVMLPGLLIALTCVAFNTASDALREAMDTKLD